MFNIYYRLKDHGLQCYTIENNTLFLCFSLSIAEITEEMIPIEIRQRFPGENLKIVTTNEPLFKLHHQVESGDKLHPHRQNAESYGTVGMFGSIYQRSEITNNEDNETSMRCCISSPHVISSEHTAYFLHGNVELGKCIWPPAVEDSCINVEDISVIHLKFPNIEINRKVKETITLFNGDRRNLLRRKVYKFGASTSRTTGFIRDSQLELTIGEPVDVFLIEPENADDDSSRFSKEGDSGAIVLTNFGEKVVAVCMIFGGDVNIEGIARNSTIAVDLNRAVARYTDGNKNKALELDTI